MKLSARKRSAARKPRARAHAEHLVAETAQFFAEALSPRQA
jgi:hypothetical protein